MKYLFNSLQLRFEFGIKFLLLMAMIQFKATWISSARQMNHRKLFSNQYELFEPISPQPAQLGIHVYYISLTQF